MANKINSSSFFNRPEGDMDNPALDLANQSFNISTALQAQVSSLVKDISAIQFLFQENDTFVHDSFLRLQQSFDTLSETVRILSGDVSGLSSKFLLLEQNRAKQLDAESLRLFEKEDAEQKGRGKKGGAFGGLFGGGSDGGLGGVNQEDLSPDTGGGGLGGIAGALAGMAGFALVGGLIKGVTSLVDGVKSIGKGIGNGLKSIGETVGNGIKSVKSAIGDGIKSAGKGIKSAGKGLWSGITGTADFLTGGLTDFDGKGKGKYNLFGDEKTEPRDIPEELVFNRTERTTDKTVNETTGEVTKEKTKKESSGAIRKSDLLEHQDQILSQLPEGTTIESIIDGTSGIPAEKLYPILESSDANKASIATRRAETKARMEKRGIGNRLLGGIDAATGNLTDFDQKGGKTFGSGRVLGGLVDSASGGLTDMDKRGITGTVDFLSGDRLDLDRQGKKRKKNPNQARINEILSGHVGEKERDELVELGYNPRRANFRRRVSDMQSEVDASRNMQKNPDGSISGMYKNTEGEWVQAPREQVPVKPKLQSNENSIKDMIVEVVTTPPVSDEIRPIIEVPGTNTTSQENESSNKQGAPPVATTTPVSGTTCTINCINMLKSNSVYNLNIGS
jgi:hypothetical protein